MYDEASGEAMMLEVEVYNVTIMLLPNHGVCINSAVFFFSTNQSSTNESSFV